MNLRDIIIYSVVVPLLVYFVARATTRKHYPDINFRTWNLIVACVLFAASIYIPSPLIEGRDTQFLTHLIGGGIFSGLVWMYFSPIHNKWPWYVSVGLLFGIVSALGVLNELFELTLKQTGIKTDSLFDTSWDLFANTLGAAIVYVVYCSTEWARKGFHLK